jgi:hypothetical protein
VRSVRTEPFLGGKKKSSSVSSVLREHLELIASAGGKARAAKLSLQRKRAIGRKGGKLGGKARAAALTKEERSESAKKASAARWEKYRKEERHGVDWSPRSS